MQPVSPKRQAFAAPSRREEMVGALSHGVIVGRDGTLVWLRSGSKAIKIFSR